MVRLVPVRSGRSAQVGQIRSGQPKFGQMSSGKVGLVRSGQVDQVRSSRSIRLGLISSISLVQFRAGSQVRQFRSGQSV